MATKRITKGWRGFSNAKESAYGTPATVDRAFNFEGPPTDIEVNDAQTNEEEITGLNEPSTYEILSYKLDGNHKQRAMPHNLAFFVGLVMGKVTTLTPDAGGNATVRDHFFERDLVNVDLPPVTMVEFDGITAKQFPGIFGKTFKLSADRSGFVQMECDFGGMGKEESSAISKPTVIQESYLRYGDVEFTRGGSLSGTVADGDLAVGGGPTSFKGALKNFEWTLNNNAKTIYEMGDNTGFVTRVERGDRFSQDLSGVFEMADDTHKTGLINGTAYVLNIPIVGGVIPGGTGAYNFSGNLIFPKVVYKEAKKEIEGHDVIVNTSFQILDDATYGSVIFKITNEQAAYLA
jgi:hypothetical protein